MKQVEAHGAVVKYTCTGIIRTSHKDKQNTYSTKATKPGHYSTPDAQHQLTTCQSEEFSSYVLPAKPPATICLTAFRIALSSVTTLLSSSKKWTLIIECSIHIHHCKNIWLAKSKVGVYITAVKSSPSQELTRLSPVEVLVRENVIGLQQNYMHITRK